MDAGAQPRGQPWGGWSHNFGPSSPLKPPQPFDCTWDICPAPSSSPWCCWSFGRAMKFQVGPWSPVTPLGVNPPGFCPCDDQLSQTNLLSTGLGMVCSTTGRADKEQAESQKGQRRNVLLSLKPTNHKTFLSFPRLKSRPLFFHLPHCFSEGRGAGKTHQV